MFTAKPGKAWQRPAHGLQLTWSQHSQTLSHYSLVINFCVSRLVNWLVPAEFGTVATCDSAVSRLLQLDNMAEALQ